MKYFLIILACLWQTSVFAQKGELQVASETFAIQPVKGMRAAHTRADVNVDEVYTDIKTNVLMMKDGEKELLFVTSALSLQYRKVIVSAVQEFLPLDESAIVTASSHNHTVPLLIFGEEPNDKKSADYLSWKIGKEFFDGLRKALQNIGKNLKPVDVYYGKAEENRISYNRRGVYPNGKTFFMREEDRQMAGEGYRGLIDPDVSVVVFKNTKTGKPEAALMMFACHPVVAYNPEKQFVHGQFPQIAAEMLSKELGDIPVGFLQGCSGDINAKYMLTGTIEQANEAGKMLGETAVIAARNLTCSKRSGLDWAVETAHIPYDDLPSEASLKRSLQEIDDFIERGNAGDENTLNCIGMNFPKALTPPYRAILVQGVRNWYVWALQQHAEKMLYTLPEYVAMPIVIARFGDAGFVGMPYEPFVKTGLKIKSLTNLPMVLPGGYTNGSMGYIPDETATKDLEYMSGYYRYVGSIPPYKAPAGDAAANVAIEVLNKYAK